MATNNSINSSYPLATTDIANSAITYAKMQNAATVTLLGNPTGSPAAPSEITLGAGLSFSGTTLVAKGSVPYTDITGTTQTAAVNNGYTANNASLVTITLPSIAAYGDVIELQGKGAGGWTLAQNASQLVHFGAQVTTTGTGGSLSSSAQYDFIRVRCIVANTTWVVQDSIGNITYA